MIRSKDMGRGRADDEEERIHTHTHKGSQTKSSDPTKEQGHLQKLCVIVAKTTSTAKRTGGGQKTKKNSMRFRSSAAIVDELNKCEEAKYR